MKRAWQSAYALGVPGKEVGLSPKVVVGFEDSSEGRDALRLGAELARADEVELVVAVVLDGLFADQEEIDLAAAPVLEAAKQALGDTQFSAHATSGSAPEALHRLAERGEVDVLVVGSTHRGAAGRILPGGVGHRLLSGTPCPVAVAPRGYATELDPGISVIGVGFDGHLESEEALRYAGTLAQRTGASLLLIGALPPDVRINRIGTEIGPDVRESMRQGLKEALERGERMAPDGVATESVIDEGDPVAVLAGRGVECDLLVVGSRGYGPVRTVLLGGVSGPLMSQAPCPVIAVPRPGTGS